MQELKKAQGLAGAAGHLCAAYEELAAAGYDGWSGELRMLIDIIDAEIEWLRSRDFSSLLAD
jgi:hypothetical protein